MTRAFRTRITSLPKPCADFTGKTIIITGANGTLGLEAARHFVRLNAEKVILGCRNADKGKTAKTDLEITEGRTGVVEVWEVDLGSFDSVKAFCRRADELNRLDVVVENAGLSTSQYEACEGYERQLTVNVISTFLMAALLIPTLRRTRREIYGLAEDQVPHLVIVGCNGHFGTPFKARTEASVFEAMKGDFAMDDRYSDTKLMAVLLMRELAKRMDSSDDKTKTVLNMADPGSIRTDLLREKPFALLPNVVRTVKNRVLARTPEVGSRTYVMAASAGLRSHGGYLEDCEIGMPDAFVDSDQGKRLQSKVFKELMEALERIHPGISGNI